MIQRQNRPLRMPGEFPRTFQILIFFVMTTAAYAQTAFVRVNQVGYVSGSSKRAYLMASGSETGATFAVKNSSGSTLFGPAAIDEAPAAFAPGRDQGYAQVGAHAFQ